MIRVCNLSKVFDIPHEKKLTLKEHVLSFLTGRKTAREPLCALKEVSFEVHKGEFFSIIGKNGSGKSTLLKIMAGIYAPASGGVAVEGKVSPFLELGIGFNPDLTARENVFISAAVLGLSKREIRGLYDTIISFAELEKFQDQALKNFSSGMKVRLAFSVAFLVDAEILLVDEVLAVGDASFTEKCYDVFRRLKGEGKTIVFVSHGMGDVQEFSDRVMLLHEGKIVSIGEPAKVVHDYQLLTAREDERRLALAELKKEKTAQEKAPVFTPPADDRRWGSGRVKIGGIDFLSSERKVKHVYATGDAVTMRIALENSPARPEPFSVSVAIHRSDGVNVFETRSDVFRFEEQPVPGKRFIDLSFPRLMLLGGIYYFDVGLLPTGEDKEPLDFVKNGCQIRVYQDNKSAFSRGWGISFLEHRWSGGSGGSGGEVAGS
jgi:ABC-type polysaccharide/polyol phosphate transport system ATPase subunit